LARRLFVTGASGFVGGHLLDAARDGGIPVVALARDAERARRLHPAVEWVEGDLAEPARWAAALAPGDVVVHLAAVTGKAPARVHDRVNREGTRALLAASAAADAAHFVFVSSVAVRFPEQRHYPYAHAKAAAERLVREGPLPWTIVRPTLVVGPGAPVLESFAMLAGMPWTPVFGPGNALVQPIDGRDLGRLLLVLALDPPASEVIELGGPERLRLGDWIGRIRAVRGRGRPRLLHLPLAPTRALLAAVEPLLLRWLPLTAGQLATFANDGVATPHPFAARFASALQPLDSSLAAPTPGRLPPEIADEATLTRECHTLTRHLIGREAPDGVIAGYLRHHRERPLGATDPFEASLLARARRGGLATRMADAYAARVLPRGLLRRKLTLLLALLETQPESYTAIDAPDPGGTLRTWLGLAARGFGEVAVAALALPWLGWAHWRTPDRHTP